MNPVNANFAVLRPRYSRTVRGITTRRAGSRSSPCTLGKNRRSGWRLPRDVYGTLGSGQPLGLATNKRGLGRIPALVGHQSEPATSKTGSGGAFGNHRKYQSLDANSASGTGAAIASYVAWVRPHGTHSQTVPSGCRRCGHDRRKTFNALYGSMRVVASFGRTARFDYLTMIGKLGLAPIEPGSTYMTGGDGPTPRGAVALYWERKRCSCRQRIGPVARLISKRP